MPAPTQPPPAACKAPRKKAAPTKPWAAPARLRTVQLASATKKQTAQPADTFVAAPGQTRPKPSAYICAAPASPVAAASKLSFAEVLLQLDRRLEHSPYYSRSAHPTGQSPKP